jgi:preprotein translocase subunit SecD
MRQKTLSFLLFLLVLPIGAITVAATPIHNCTQRQITQSLLKPGTLEIWNTGSVSVPTNARFNPRLYLTTIPYGKPIFTGADLDPKSLSMGQDPLTAYYFINFTMKGAAALRLAKFTADHLGNYITITLNKVVVSSPMIQYALPGKGQFQMSPRSLALLGIKCAKT